MQKQTKTYEDKGVDAIHRDAEYCIFQLRSEDTGIIHANSIREALQLAELDKSIWKISFNSAGNERIHLIRCNFTREWILQLLFEKEINV